MDSSTAAAAIPTRAAYAAFISYKHHANLPFAERIAKALRTYARPLLKPPLRVFRDEEYFLPNESLPTAIRRALVGSNFLVLLASTEAAASVWVRDELRIWCGELKRASNLLIVLTKDEIGFDPNTKRVNWTTTTALPAFLSEFITDSPLYVDLRWVTEEQQLDLANPRFKREINRLAARLNDIDPEQMLNREVITHRRNVWLARGAVTALAVFALAAVTGLVIAQYQRGLAQGALANEQIARDKAEGALANEAVARNQAEVALANERIARDRAEAEAAAAASNLLATRARQRTIESPQLGVLLAAEAVFRLQQKQLPVTSAAAQALLDMFENVSGLALGGHRLERARADSDRETTISAVAVSPDSKWIATGDADGRVLLRRSSRPEQWVELIGARDGRSREAEIHRLQFSADSTRLAAGLFDEVRVWDISGRPKVIARCTGHKQFVSDALFTDDTRWLISSSGSGIRVWDLKADPPVGELLPETKGLHAVLAMNGDLVVSDDGYVWRWRERRLVRKLPGIDDDSISLAVSPQGDKVAVGTSKGNVHVWWLATEEHKVFHHGDFIGSVAFSPDGNSLASGSWNRTAKLWDLTGKERERTYEHDGKVEALAFHPSGQQLATTANRRVRVWGTYWLYTPAPMVLGGHEGNGAAQHLAFSSDGTFLVSGGYEPLPRLWRLNQLNPGVDVFRGGSYGHFESFATSLNNQRLAAVTRHSGPDLWRLDQPGQRVVTLPYASNNAFQVALSPDGAWLASSGVGSESFLWRTDAPHQAPRQLRAKTGYHNKVLFSPEGDLIGALDSDGSVVLESIVEPNAPLRKLRGGIKPAVDFAFGPSLPHVAAVYPDGSVYLWDTRASTRQQIAAGALNPHPIGVAFSVDGTHVAVADSTFIVWVDLGTRSTVRLVPPEGQRITKFAIAPGALHIAAGTSTGTTLLWDLTKTASRRELSLHTLDVRAVAFSPGGDWLASATRDTIGIWSLRDLAAAPLRLIPERVKYLAPLTSDRTASVSDMRFIDRHRVAASTGDHLVVVWDLDFTTLIARACEVAGRPLRPDEVVTQLDGSPAIACGPRSPSAQGARGR